MLPLAFLLWMLARDRSARIQQAHGRLKLVEQERVRLQSAVRRLGDAFAAKLELDALLEILLHGSVEALDAAAGRLELIGIAALAHAADGLAERSLRRTRGLAPAPGTPRPAPERDGRRLDAARPGADRRHPREVTGTLAFARPRARASRPTRSN